jgi:hypothetical protein
MDDKALGYVTQVKDHQQFPAARVAYGARVEGEMIHMYQRSSSSTAELMNAANKLVRNRTAVDPINAMILLLKLEAKRYADNKEKAWEWTEVLTPHGQKLSNYAFKSSALNLNWIYMTALCCQTGQTTPTTVGFQPHMMKITLFLVDAPVEYPQHRWHTLQSHVLCGQVIQN